MQKRGVGPHDREDSERLGHVRQALERELSDVDFPIEKWELLDRKGDVELRMGAGGQTVTLRDMLQNVNAHQFVAPNHVTEVLDVDWNDMADIIDPGGTGKSHEWHFADGHRRD